MLGNIVKHFEWPLVRKALYECSPLLLLLGVESYCGVLRCSPQLHLQDLTIMLESCSTLGVRPE